MYIKTGLYRIMPLSTNSTDGLFFRDYSNLVLPKK